jgi:cell division protease FtsH
MDDQPASVASEPNEDLLELARNLTDVLKALRHLAPSSGASDFVSRLQVHLGVDPLGLPVLSQELPSYQLVDLQVGLEVWTAASGDRTVDVFGISGDQRRFHPLSELLGGMGALGIGVGPVDYVDLADSPDSTRTCVRFGMFLLGDGENRCAALIRGADPHGPMQQAMIEVIAEDREFGSGVLAELRRLAVEHSVLRGQVLTLGSGEGNQYGALTFMRRPIMERSQLVLPDETLQTIERHVVGIADHSDRLLEAGQHLKRGVLLYGPPGTGKTHTVRYLLGQLQDTTAFVLSGQALAMIGQACGLARLLQPSIVIMEDVDLIAGDRSFGPMGGNPLLFEVLNQIDGLGDDVDVTFLLTTNRVDILERALAERPGRVDAAVEIAPPDAEGRVRLLRLYGEGLGVGDLSDADLVPTVEATEGRTATYLREVVRRAALLSADASPVVPLRVDGETLTKAATDLLADRAQLTRSILGGASEPDAEPPMGAPGFMGGPMMGHPMFRGFPGSDGPPIPFGPESVG